MTTEALRFTDYSTSAQEFLADDIAVHRDVMVRMRDGICLATDIYRPVVDGKLVETPLPVIMERTPYGKSERSRSEIEPGMTQPMTRGETAAHFVRAGYVVIYQDCRGRYRSEGKFTKYLSEGADGFDTCAWIVEQPWCDGQIGTMGLSYAAHTQAALASLNPPGLACMVMDSGGFSSAYRTGIRQGGAFELKQLTWAYNNAKESPEAQNDPLVRKALEAEDIKAWFTVMPWSEGRSPVRWVPEYEAYVLEQWRQGAFGEFWKKTGIYAEGAYERFPQVPVALMSSWYDAYVRTTFDNYEGLSRSGQRPLCLIMGAGLHGNRNSTFAGDVEFGPRAPLAENVTPSLARVPAALVRPLAQEIRERRGRGARRSPVPHGWRHRPKNGIRQTRSWREMDRSLAVAIADGRAASLLPASRRETLADASGARHRAAQL